MLVLTLILKVFVWVCSPAFQFFIGVWRSQPYRFNTTKTLFVPSLTCFYSYGQLTQTCPALAIKTVVIWIAREEDWSRRRYKSVKSIVTVEVKKNKNQDVRSRLSVPHRLASELLEDTPTILTGVLFHQLFFRKKTSSLLKVRFKSYRRYNYSLSRRNHC